MSKSIFAFVISLLVAPGLGLVTARIGLSSCPEYTCDAYDTLTWFREASSIALAVTLGLPLLYVLAAFTLGLNRDLLARWFPPLVWVVMGILPMLMAAHGLLVWMATYELQATGIMIARSWKLLAVIFTLGGGLIFSGFIILMSLRKLLSLDPLRVTGVVLEPQEMPELFARVKRLAQKLGSREPQRIVLGVEPTAYVANVPLRLRGVGDLPVAETLYLPTGALRVLDDAELDALIGHELGHFRGADLEFSSRFAPAFRSMSVAAEDVAVESGGDNSPWLDLALMPALGFLSFMLYTLGRVTNRIGRQREFEADKASLEVASPRAVGSLLVKFTVLSLQWQPFRAGITRLLNEGQGRRNISLDYLARTRQLIERDSEKLRRFILESHTPHPLDSHPTLAQRAQAAGVDAQSAIGPSLVALLSERPVPASLTAIEERISAIDVDYYRHPSFPVTVTDDPQLPPALSYY